MRILITGANGHLGRKLIRKLQDEASADTGTEDSVEIVAMVRSERAAASIRDDGLTPTIKIVDYTDVAGIREASQGCDKIVHLSGIIKESENNSFEMAHEHACKALVAALAHTKPAAQLLVCLGIIGTSAASHNKCFASRAAAETILAAGEVPTVLLRVPMVLGEDDYASRSLAKKGQSTFAFTFRAASMEQPIYSDDVVNALIRALTLEPESRVLELAGPETVTRSELLKRAGRVFKNNPKVISVPIFIGYMAAFVFELVSRNPPVTRAMLGVLDHDDSVDTRSACLTLGLSLTSLDEVLVKVLGGKK